MTFQHVAVLLCVLSALPCDGVRTDFLEANESLMEETGYCTGKTYYFQLDASQGAMEMHTIGEERVLHIYPGRSWEVSIPRTGRMWTADASGDFGKAQWDKCWPQWWTLDYVDKSEWWQGCQHGRASDRVMKLQSLKLDEQHDEPASAVEGVEVKTIQLSKVSKIAAVGEGASASLIIDYIDESGDERSFTLNKGEYYPERVLKVLLEDITSHNSYQRSKDYEKRSMKNAPNLDELTSTGSLEYQQGAGKWMQNGYRGTGGMETGLISLAGALTGGILGLTARAPLAIWNKVKEDKELHTSAADKLFAKLSECSTFFKKCGKYELVSKGSECS